MMGVIKGILGVLFTAHMVRVQGLRPGLSGA